MATSVVTKNNTGNPRNRLSSSAERNRRALEGCIGEWDMLTYSPTDPKVLIDLSGAGNNFTFINNPTLNAEGFVFDGVNYGDMILAAPLVNNYSILLVYRRPTQAGYYLFGNENISIPNSGVSVQHNVQTRFNTQSSNYASVLASGTSTLWGVLLTVEEFQGRGRPLNGGQLSVSNCVRSVDFTEAVVRRRWRIGGRAKTVSGDVDVISESPLSGTLCYAMLFNKVKDFTEGFCLHEYVHEKMLLRGINYTA